MSFQEPTIKKHKDSSYAEMEPQKWYPIVLKEGKIDIALTPNAKSKKKVIYVFKNNRTNKLLIGETGELITRIRVYKHAFNHPEKEIGQYDLPKAIRESPEDFSFGILYEAEPHEDLQILEKIFILEKKVFHELYNKNCGGGGGNPAIEQKPKIEISPSKLKTPEKSYPVKVIDGKPSVLLTPSVKKVKNFIYGFINTETDERLYGKSEREVAKRIAEYHFAFRHPEKECGQKPFPSAVREDPEAWKFVVCVQNDEADLSHLEQVFIAAKNSISQGYNQNKGGGGSSARRKLAFV